MCYLKNGPCGERYLVICGVNVSARMPIIAQIFLTPVEKILLDKDTITVDDLANEYRQRIEMGMQQYTLLGPDEEFTN